MSWFGDGTTAQKILDDVKHWESAKELSKSEVIKILADIISYYAQYGKCGGGR